MLEDLVTKNGLHPNRISALGLVSATASVVAASFEETKFIAPVVYAFGAGLDYADGLMARRYNLKTKEGAILDPLCDKLKNFAVGGLMIYNSYRDNLFLVGANVANFVVDAVSQSKRGSLKEQFVKGFRSILSPYSCVPDNDVSSNLRANVFGKVKTAVQNISHFVYLSYVAYPEKIEEIFGEGFEDNYLSCVSVALLTSAVIGSVGILKRGKIKKKL